MPQVVWSRPALADLQRLHAFLKPKSPAAASRAIAVVRAAAKELASFPEMGRGIEELDAGFREWPIPFGRDGYLLLYRVWEGTVVILAVRHGREAGY